LSIFQTAITLHESLFSNFTVKSTAETSVVGTRAIPVNFPFNSGITFPTAFAAPVEDGIYYMKQHVHLSIFEGPSVVI
jgi:hypothetical protein